MTPPYYAQTTGIPIHKTICPIKLSRQWLGNVLLCLPLLQLLQCSPIAVSCYPTLSVAPLPYREPSLSSFSQTVPSASSHLLSGHHCSRRCQCRKLGAAELAASDDTLCVSVCGGFIYTSRLSSLS